MIDGKTRPVRIFYILLVNILYNAARRRNMACKDCLKKKYWRSLYYYILNQEPGKNCMKKTWDFTKYTFAGILALNLYIVKLWSSCSTKSV